MKELLCLHGPCKSSQKSCTSAMEETIPGARQGCKQSTCCSILVGRKQLDIAHFCSRLNGDSGGSRLGVRGFPNPLHVCHLQSAAEAMHTISPKG